MPSAPCCRVLDVARFVDDHLSIEEQKGCELCATNRKILEKAWQVIANEYFDPSGKFSQAAWARQLLKALQVGRKPCWSCMSCVYNRQSEAS